MKLGLKKEKKQQKVKKCSNCEGTGIVEEEKTCPVCNGRGHK